MCSKDRPLSKSVKPGEDVFGYVHLSSFLVSAESFLRVSSIKSMTNEPSSTILTIPSLTLEWKMIAYIVLKRP